MKRKHLETNHKKIKFLNLLALVGIYLLEYLQDSKLIPLTVL